MTTTAEVETSTGPRSISEAAGQEWLKNCDLWRKNFEKHTGVLSTSQSGLTEIKRGHVKITRSDEGQTDTSTDRASGDRPSAGRDDGRGEEIDVGGDADLVRCPRCLRSLNGTNGHTCTDPKAESATEAVGAANPAIPKWLWPALTAAGITIGAGSAGITSYFIDRPAEPAAHEQSALQYLQDRGGHLRP